LKRHSIAVAWALALAGVAAMSSVNSAGAATPVLPNTANSTVAETVNKVTAQPTESEQPAESQQPPLSNESAEKAANGLKERADRPDQEIVRAVVDSNGTLVVGQSSGATSATRLSVGTYQPCFNERITNGTYVASIGLPGNVFASPPGEITVVGRVSTNNCLFIQTFNSSGTLADRGFHVIVVFNESDDN
jgi:hypothetical protein